MAGTGQSVTTALVGHVCPRQLALWRTAFRALRDATASSAHPTAATQSPTAERRPTAHDWPQRKRAGRAMKINRPPLIIFALAVCSIPWLIRQDSPPTESTSASPSTLDPNPIINKTGAEFVHGEKLNPADIATDPGPNIATYAIKPIPTSNTPARTQRVRKSEARKKSASRHKSPTTADGFARQRICTTADMHECFAPLSHALLGARCVKKE